MTTFIAFIGNLGWTELVIIFAFVLLFFGPKRLPEIAEAFGKSIKKFKKATREAQDEVKRELDTPPEEEPKSDGDSK